jgi:hypothetical protein
MILSKHQVYLESINVQAFPKAHVRCNSSAKLSLHVLNHGSQAMAAQGSIADPTARETQFWFSLL